MLISLFSRKRGYRKTVLSSNQTTCTFFLQEKTQDHPRQHGVDSAIKNSLTVTVETPTDGSERIISLRLSISSGSVRLFSIYAPTLYSTPEQKDKFYEALDEEIFNKPSTGALHLLGDFNARIGTDNESWPSCLGPWGTF